jgi:nitrate reductase NapE
MRVLRSISTVHLLSCFPFNPRIHPMTAPVGASSSRRREVATFTLLAFVVVPALSIAAVGGYGLCVWMYQLVAGPPGL